MIEYASSILFFFSWRFFKSSLRSRVFLHSIQFLSDGDFQVKAPGNLDVDVHLHVGCRPIRCLGYFDTL